MRRELRALAALDATGRRDALRALLLLTLLPPLLRGLGLATTRRLLLGHAGARGIAQAPRATAARACALRHRVEAVARHLPWRPRCLARALTLWLLLRREGVPAQLRLGVRRQGPALLAHAWVEWAGTPLEPAGSWTPLPSGTG